MAVLQNLGGLKLFNPATKRESIRRTFKTIGPVRQPQLSSVFELTEDDTLTESPPTVHSSEPIADVDDFKYLIGTTHRDNDTLELHVTVDVLAEEFDAEVGCL